MRTIVMIVALAAVACATPLQATILAPNVYRDTAEADADAVKPR